MGSPPSSTRPPRACLINISGSRRSLRCAPPRRGTRPRACRSASPVLATASRRRSAARRRCVLCSRLRRIRVVALRAIRVVSDVPADRAAAGSLPGYCDHADEYGSRVRSTPCRPGPRRDGCGDARPGARRGAWTAAAAMRARRRTGRVRRRSPVGARGRRRAGGSSSTARPGSGRSRDQAARRPDPCNSIQPPVRRVTLVAC